MQRLQRKIVGNTLLELAHAGFGQAFVELRLTEKYDMHEFVPVGLQIRQQADFFQRLGGHGVRLVDHDHHLATGGVNIDQMFLQGTHNGVHATFGH